MTALHPDNPESVRGSGIFTGIWSVVSPLVALFVGGLVAGHSAGAITRGDGAFYGIVMWGLTTIAGLWLITRIFTAAIGGAAAVGAEAMDRPDVRTPAPLQDPRGVAPRIEERLRGAGIDRETVADRGAMAFWGIFGMLFLGLAASLGGAAVGVSRRQRLWAERKAGYPGSIVPPVVTTPVAPVAYTQQPGPVYP